SCSFLGAVSRGDPEVASAQPSDAVLARGGWLPGRNLSRLPRRFYAHGWRSSADCARRRRGARPGPRRRRGDRSRRAVPLAREPAGTRAPAAHFIDRPPGRDYTGSNIKPLGIQAVEVIALKALRGRWSASMTQNTS